MPPIDGPRGADNAFGASILRILQEHDETFETQVRERMAASPLLLRIRDWNGTMDDPDLEVVIVEAARLIRDDGGPLPLWDGTDRWEMSERDLLPTGDEALRDRSAYMEDGLFVARMPANVPIPLPWLGNRWIELPLQDTRVTGQLAGEAPDAIDVWIQGVITRSSLLRALDDAGICTGSDLRRSIETELASVLDATTTAEGADVLCDAISIAFSFNAFRVQATAWSDPGPHPDLGCIE